MLVDSKNKLWLLLLYHLPAKNQKYETIPNDGWLENIYLYIYYDLNDMFAQAYS